MSNIDKIRQEIERRIKSCDANSKTPDQLLWAELGALIAFLDTLEEPDKDLEEAAKKYRFFDFGTPDEIAQTAFKAGAEWQYQKDRAEFAKLKAREWINGYNEGLLAKGKEDKK